MPNGNGSNKVWFAFGSIIIAVLVFMGGYQAARASTAAMYATKAEVQHNHAELISHINAMNQRLDFLLLALAEKDD